MFQDKKLDLSIKGIIAIAKFCNGEPNATFNNMVEGITEEWRIQKKQFKTLPSKIKDIQLELNWGLEA